MRDTELNKNLGSSGESSTNHHIENTIILLKKSGLLTKEIEASLQTVQDYEAFQISLSYLSVAGILTKNNFNALKSHKDITAIRLALREIDGYGLLIQIRLWRSPTLNFSLID